MFHRHREESINSNLKLQHLKTLELEYMLAKNIIDFENLTFQHFQKLCLHLAQNGFRDCTFEEFLREGNDQEGIDLLSIQQPGGKFITIQCKRVNSFSESNSKKAIEDFVESYFLKEASIFILAVSCPIGERAKKYLLKSAKEIRSKFNVELRVWDRSFLEEQLRKEFTLVSLFFGSQIAHEHCFAPSYLPRTKTFDPVKPYIERKISPFLRVDDSLFRWWNVAKESILTLTSVINNNRLTTKQICLIGDAYQGKTFLFRQTAYELQNLSVPFSPLLVELKFQVIQPIALMLDQHFGAWKTLAAKDTILLIDGMDEVPSEKFYEMLLYIKAFSNSHPYITLVFSCRKLFFEHYKVEQVLSDFSIYELYPLSEIDVKGFIRGRLYNRAEEFERLVSAGELHNFLYHPFYLTNLIETFQTSPANLPSSKVGLVDQFIDKAYSEQSHRRISGGKALKDRRITYRQAIQKLAFALQLAGRNAMTEEEVQFLFTENERELLQHNSLITAHLEQWSFANALFQEHLAALALAKMDFAQIISFISVGRKIKKVRTKWIQTVASLLSLLDEKDSKYQNLLKFLEDDNIELLFTTERTKYSEPQRVAILKKLLQRCKEKNIRPILIYESRIAIFIDRDKKAISVLVDEFNEIGQTSVIKIVICEILCDLSCLQGYEDKFFKKAQQALVNERDAYTSGKIVQVLARFVLGDNTTADLLVNHPHSFHHDFRKAVYQYLIAKEYVDDYYDYGLNGIQTLIEYNRGITHAGSEFWFTQFLLNTSSGKHLRQLIEKLTDSIWLAYFDNHSLQQNEILSQVCQLSINIFPKDPAIAVTMANLLKKLERYKYKDVYRTVIEFFNKSNSHSLAIRALVKEILKEGEWEFAALIREPILDYLLWEWEEGNYSVNILRPCVWGLQHFDQGAIAEKVRDLLNQATEGKIDEHVPNPHDDWQKDELRKRENDIKYIQSVESFKVGVEQFFKAYGKAEIPDNEIYVDFEDKQIRKKFDSNFIRRFLTLWVAQGKKATLSRSYKILNNRESFEYFRANEIVDYNFHGTDDENILKEIAKTYFENHIGALDFTNSIWQTKNKIIWWRKQALVGELFDKFEFDAPAPQLMELIWLDQGGTRNFETANLNKRQSITQKILAKLKEEDMPYFRQKIVDNLKIGISCNGVLGNHIGLFRHLKIFEAKNLLADLLLSLKGDEVSRVDLLDIYLDLGGDLTVVLPYFKKFNDFNSYSYFHFVSKFIESYCKQVHASLLKCMAAVTVTKENKVRAAQYLCMLGDFAGFKYLAEELRLSYKAPYSIQSFSKMTALNTQEVLEEIKDLGFLLVDPAGSTGHHFSGAARNILTEWLQIFALKSEEDLYQVIQYYDQTYKEVKDTYPNAKNIFWHEEYVIEKFRGTDQTLLTFAQIKPILMTIEF